MLNTHKAEILTWIWIFGYFSMLRKDCSFTLWDGNASQLSWNIYGRSDPFCSSQNFSFSPTFKSIFLLDEIFILIFPFLAEKQSSSSFAKWEKGCQEEWFYCQSEIFYAQELKKGAPQIFKRGLIWGQEVKISPIQPKNFY